MLQDFMSPQQGQESMSTQMPFNRFMAKVKFCINSADFSSDEISDIFIDSGSTRHFFFTRAPFISYAQIKEEDVCSAPETSKKICKRTVKSPVGNVIIVEAYHEPAFPSNILSVSLLSSSLEIMFIESINGCSLCYIM